MGCASSSYDDESGTRDTRLRTARTIAPSQETLGHHAAHATAFAHAIVQPQIKQQEWATGLWTHANLEPHRTPTQQHGYAHSVTAGLLDGGGGKRGAFPFHKAATGLHAAPMAVHGDEPRTRPNPGVASHTDGAAGVTTAVSVTNTASPATAHVHTAGHAPVLGLARCTSSHEGARAEAAVSRSHTTVAHHMDSALGLFDEDGLLRAGALSFSKGTHQAQHLRRLSSQLHQAGSPARQHTPRRISTCSVMSAASSDAPGASAGGAPAHTAHSPRHATSVQAAAITLLNEVQQGKDGCVIKDTEEGGEGIVLQRHVGKGAFGEVYLGTYRGVRVAVKSVWGWVEEDDEETGGQGGKRERMAQVEAVLMSVLDHPHIVTTLKVMLGDVGSPVPRLLKGTQHIAMADPEVPNMYSWYIVMEYCELGSLWTALVAGTFHSLATREQESSSVIRPGLRRSFSDSCRRQSSAGTNSPSVASLSGVLPSTGQLPAPALESSSQMASEPSLKSITIPTTASDAAAAPTTPVVPQPLSPNSLTAVILGAPSVAGDGARGVLNPRAAEGIASPRGHRLHAGFKDVGAGPGSNGRGDIMVAWDAWAALATLREMVSALQYMHHNGVVHGDLKAPNILLAKGGSDRRGFVCKVTDFGFSRVIGARKRSSVLKTKSYGTVTHQPPELLRDGVLTPDADVYAVGITMWEVLTGLKVHGELSDPEVVVAVVQADLRPVWPPDTPLGYCELASACWAADPADRPSMAVVAQRLTQLQERLCPQGPDSAPILLTPRFVRVPRGNVKRSFTVPASGLMPAGAGGSPKVQDATRNPAACMTTAGMDRLSASAGRLPAGYGIHAGHAGLAGRAAAPSTYIQTSTPAAGKMQSQARGHAQAGFLYTALPVASMYANPMGGTHGCMTPSDGTASMQVSPMSNPTMWAALHRQSQQHGLTAGSNMEPWSESHALRSAYSSTLGVASTARNIGGLATKQLGSHNNLASLLLASTELQQPVGMEAPGLSLLRSHTEHLDSLSGPANIGDIRARYLTQQALARTGQGCRMQATSIPSTAPHAALAQAAATMLGMGPGQVGHGGAHHTHHHHQQQHRQHNHSQPRMPHAQTAGLQSKGSVPAPAMAQSLPASARASSTAVPDNAMNVVMAGHIAFLQAEKARLEAAMAARRA